MTPLHKKSMGALASADKGVAYTKSNSNFSFGRAKGFSVQTTAGNVQVKYADGTTEILPNIQVGQRIDVIIIALMSDNTTADGFIVYYDFN